MSGVNEKDLESMINDIFIVKKRTGKINILVNCVLITIIPAILFTLGFMLEDLVSLSQKIIVSLMIGMAMNLFLIFNTQVFDKPYCLFFYKMRVKKIFPLLTNLFKYDIINETDLTRISLGMNNLINNGGDINEINSIISNNLSELDNNNKNYIVKKILHSILMSKLKNVKEITVDKYIELISVENKELCYLANKYKCNCCELMKILFNRVDIDDFNKNIEKIISFSTIKFKEVGEKKYIINKIKDHSEKINEVMLLKGNVINKSTLSPIKICSNSKVKSI